MKKYLHIYLPILFSFVVLLLKVYGSFKKCWKLLKLYTMGNAKEKCLFIVKLETTKYYFGCTRKVWRQSLRCDIFAMSTKRNKSRILGHLHY